MSIWYRVSRQENSMATFSGEGGLRVAGRWNFVGNKSIYCSESIALCTLEWLVHHGLSVSAFNYYRYSIEVPDNFIKTFSIKELPSEWNMTPATDITKIFADKELFAANRLAMAVPSVLVPEEFNLVINPLHVAFQQIASSIKSLGKFIAPDR